MKKTYDLCSGSFRLKVQGGVLVSAMASGDGETAYLDAEKGFGALRLTFRRGEKLWYWEPFASPGYQDAPPERRGRRMCYEGSSFCRGLSVTVRYQIRGREVSQEITVENTGEEPVELLDFGIGLTSHTEFAWGENAGKQVIGHHYVAGHGSHSTLYRCDGKGALLSILPAEGSRWIYFGREEERMEGAVPVPETVPPAAGEETWARKRTVILYSLSGGVGRDRIREGAKLRIAPESVCLDCGQQYRYHGKLLLSRDYEECRDRLSECGQPVVESIPGYTVFRDAPVLLAVRCKEEELEVFTGEGELSCLGQRGRNRIYRLKFSRSGEHRVRIRHGAGETELYYFALSDLEGLMDKRGRFIADHQIRDGSLWYDGLFAEVNNETMAVLGPDNYDRIKGWRIYEVTCDDPGLSKPAYLSSLQTVRPCQAQVDALDYYLERFVWGGLQQTEEEPYPYGIYGIPDWHVLRNSKDPWVKGRAHVWRVYDYSHITLLYYNMYQVAAFAANVTTKLEARTYLKRAYGTARAMFTIPEELDGWSALKTGFYNERVIPDLIGSLKAEGLEEESRILSGWWDRKALYFARENEDIFGSEYPFDTTGFESTHVLAKRALELSQPVEEKRWDGEALTSSRAMAFLERQTECNIACRGLLEPAYFWYGSDYRGDNLHYTMSYMTQMGGCSLLDYACYYAEDPFPLLRLGYGSVLGSWALLNGGDEAENYGWWFPGKERDGCACGGFEPLYAGETWLEQPHHGGAWYYSCEIDLGFCGGLRGAATVAAEDPLFGLVCYGGELDGPHAWECGSRNAAYAKGAEGDVGLVRDVGQEAGRNAGNARGAERDADSVRDAGQGDERDAGNAWDAGVGAMSACDGQNGKGEGDGADRGPAGVLRVTSRDGVYRRFHYIAKEGRFHAECLHGQWAGEGSIRFERSGGSFSLYVTPGPWKRECTRLSVLAEELGDYRLAGTDRVIRDGIRETFSLFEGEETEQGVRFLLKRC